VHGNSIRYVQTRIHQPATGIDRVTNYRQDWEVLLEQLTQRTASATAMGARINFADNVSAGD
jgi:hypothetical protein